MFLTLRLSLSDGTPYFTNTSKIQLKNSTIYFLFVENWITFNIKESFMRKPFPWLYIHVYKVLTTSILMCHSGCAYCLGSHS